MKKIVSFFIFLLLLTGCGDTNDSLQSNEPTQKGTSAISTDSPLIKEVKAPTIPDDDGTFSAIHTLISNANQGFISDATYICVGDSTRAESSHNGQYLFYELEDELRRYNVNSHLLARAGHQAKQFAYEDTTPTWRDVVSYIPADGADTIVDISLGINDCWDNKKYSIKRSLRDAITKIKSKKPKTHFLLSVPNRVYNDRAMTNFLRDTYVDLSKELKIPLNNLIDDLMPTKSSTPYSWYRNDGFNVHLSRTGQSVVARFILGNMLP